MVDYMPLTAAAMLAILAKAETQAATLQQAQCNKFNISIPMSYMMHASLLITCMELTITQHNTVFMTVCTSISTAATAAHLLHNVSRRWESAKRIYGQSTMQLLLAGPNLSLLQVDNCLYLVRQDALQSRLEQMSSCNSNPAFIAVSSVNGTPCLTMASEHDVKVRQKNISTALGSCFHATPSLY